MMLKSFILVMICMVFQVAKAEDFASRFFSIAMNRSTDRYLFPQVHLVRVPKASSTSFSAITRRIVGCSPPGPCCKYPGDPVGSCPDKMLFQCQVQKKVLGCTGHTTDYIALKSQDIPSMTFLREPISRSLSAFFYPGIHHNNQCQVTSQEAFHTCFQEYLHSNAWSNIAVKMFTGGYAYANVSTCSRGNECRHSLDSAIKNIQHFNFLGISELWELSILLLYATYPHISPVLEDFQLHERSSKGKDLHDHSHSTTIVRNITWQHSLQALAQATYPLELQHQNRYDIILYASAVQSFCHQLKRLQLWSYEDVRSYWHSKMIIPCE